ncbi:hypothetical protein DLREEDagrD3_02040 [Denitratisoma sp. agr-D3]
MTATSHTWRFFRAGGFDQVRLDRAADLLALDRLDQKLWVALSCPTIGIEFDARTLALIDSDGDGHIRAAELLAAIAWAAERLADREVLARSLPGLPLAALADNPAGTALAAAGTALLAELGKPADALLTVAEAAAAEERCRARLQAQWQAQGQSADVLPLGADTPAAHAALTEVRAKIDDYFTRCRLAAFDPQGAAALNPDPDTLRALGTGLLHGAADAVAALPLARVEAGRALPLKDGLNPAWADAVAAFADAVARPLVGGLGRNELTESQWLALQAAFVPYQDWLAADPAQATEPPAELLAARDLERLARYVRDLLPLANNFVAFRDFYNRQPGTKSWATFQLGTLYLDGRSAELCVAVTDPAKHAALAGLSRMCLVYCDCLRQGEAGVEKMTIAAAFTAGDADQLLVGRNGVFYDRRGRDWDATIVRIVDHPISLRQAFWSPYKRLARLVAEQLQKIAANKAAGVEAKLAETAAGVAKKVDAPAKAPAQQAFDVGKFAGIFAAIGLAVGALGTALASLVTGLLGLAWWQVPLALAGLMLAVSGPAMIVAAFKLRGRNLGPLLDANGWAINARARINIPFGTSLTGLAQLPPGAERALTDPYADKPFPWGRVLLAAAVLGAAAVTWWTFTP